MTLFLCPAFQLMPELKTRVIGAESQLQFFAIPLNTAWTIG